MTAIGTPLLARREAMEAKEFAAYVLEAKPGAITSMFVKMPGDPQWGKDRAAQAYYAFMKH
jgi:hypothetical protein